MNIAELGPVQVTENTAENDENFLANFEELKLIAEDESSLAGNLSQDGIIIISASEMQITLKKRHFHPMSGSAEKKTKTPKLYGQ